MGQQIQTVLNSDGISDFFSYTLSINKSANKTTCLQADLPLCCFVVLLDLMIYVPSTIFQLLSDGSSWVEPLLS